MQTLFHTTVYDSLFLMTKLYTQIKKDNCGWNVSSMHCHAPLYQIKPNRSHDNCNQTKPNLETSCRFTPLPSGLKKKHKKSTKVQMALHGVMPLFVCTPHYLMGSLFQCGLPSRGKSYFCWSSMARDIQSLVLACSVCSVARLSIGTGFHPQSNSQIGQPGLINGFYNVWCLRILPLFANKAHGLCTCITHCQCLCSCIVQITNHLTNPVL